MRQHAVERCDTTYTHMESRRNFFEEIVACGGLAALLAGSAEAQNKPLATGQIRTNDFWGSFYETSRGIQKAAAGPGKDVRYLFSDGSGLRYVDQIKKEELLSHAGDTQIGNFVTLGQFRPGTEDAKSVKELTSSQLRIDCVQTRPFMDILAPAAWVAMASLYTDKIGKLPSLQTLGFQQPNLMSGENKSDSAGSARANSRVNGFLSMTKESGAAQDSAAGGRRRGHRVSADGFPRHESSGRANGHGA